MQASRGEHGGCASIEAARLWQGAGARKCCARNTDGRRGPARTPHEA